MTLYFAVELLASFIEGVLILAVIAEIAGKKYTGIRHLIFLGACAGISTIIITYLNSLAAFSFLTIIVMILFSLLVSKTFSKEGVLIRTTACMLALFFLHTFDYVLGFGIALIIEQSETVFYSFDAILQPGETRAIYTIVNKSLQIIAFFLLLPMYKKIRLLNSRYITLLFSITTASYIVMSILVSLIMTKSLAIMQVAIILSWVFIMICLIAVITTLVISSRYRQKLKEGDMIALANALLEKNYANLSLNQQEIAKLVHDYSNHTIALKGLIHQPEEAEEYIDKLLFTTRKQAKLCRSQSNVINAIINCKLAEASRLQIPFTFNVNLPKKLSIASIDICAVLSNQIDNALEACTKIQENENRFIEVELWYKEHFLFFKVVNSVVSNPFNGDKELVTTKKEGIHGLGLKSIKETVDKYGGTLENLFKGNQFTSIAMMQITD